MAMSDLDAARAELAPCGILRAGINMANPLLVSGRDADGQPRGVAPDMAGAIAAALRVDCELREYPRPGETADAVGECGIVLIAFEPQRAETISFSPGYVEIETTYLARPGFSIASPEEADRAGVRIVVSERSAYDLWLTRHIKLAELVRITGLEAACSHFRAGGGDLLAGLRPALLDQRARFPGSVLLDSSFATVQQAVGTAKKNEAASVFLEEFVRQARNDGRVKQILQRNGAQGLKIPSS